jgi:DNA-3-methyladenine glycosylase
MIGRGVELGFFQESDVLFIARSLIGMYFKTFIGSVETCVRITEVEAYAGVNDRGSHVYGGKRTPRTEVFYKHGGVAYVYLCYGIHNMFNVITGPQNDPKAILIRAGEPISGVEKMLERRGMERPEKRLTTGPGSLAKAMGIQANHNGLPLNGEVFGIYHSEEIVPMEIHATPRIGIDYAGEDALLPYRFIDANSKWISGSKKLNQGPHPVTS